MRKRSIDIRGDDSKAVLFFADDLLSEWALARSERMPLKETRVISQTEKTLI